MAKKATTEPKGETDRKGKGPGKAATQFKPGDPGGPGRPKGSISLTEKARRYLQENPELADEIIQEWVARCIAKGGRDLTTMLDRLEGAVPQHVTANIDGPVVVKLEWD